MQRDADPAYVCGVGRSDGVSGESSLASSSGIAVEHGSDRGILQYASGIHYGDFSHIFQPRADPGHAPYATWDGDADRGVRIIWFNGMDHESYLRGGYGTGRRDSHGRAVR